MMFKNNQKATGGGQVYKWSTDNEDLAVADTEGKVNTHSGPGSFKVKAAMAKAIQNFDEVTVSIPNRYLGCRVGEG